MSAHSARRGPDLDEVGQSQNAFSVPRRSVAQGSRVKCVGPLPSSSFPDRCHTISSPPRLVGITSAGFLPPASPLPALLPADHPRPPCPFHLSHSRRLAGLFSPSLPTRLPPVPPNTQK